jgi:hypothetical protein
MTDIDLIKHDEYVAEQPSSGDKFFGRKIASDGTGADRGMLCSTAEQMLDQALVDKGTPFQKREVTSAAPAATDDQPDGGYRAFALIQDKTTRKIYIKVTDGIDDADILGGDDDDAAVWREFAPPQVSSGERSAGVEMALRMFAPADIAAMAVGGATQIRTSVEKESAGTIAIGRVVYAAGYDTDKLTVEEADGNLLSAQPPIGVSAESITDTSAGDIVLTGVITGLDTSAASRGDALYLSTTAGAMTLIRPPQEEAWRVGTVLRSHATEGMIQVHISRVAGEEAVACSVDLPTTATKSNSLVMVAPFTGDFSKAELCLESGTGTSDGSNNWAFALKNKSNADAALLATDYNTNTDGDLAAFAVQDLGPEHGTPANLAVSQGDLIVMDITAVGTPEDLLGASGKLSIYLRREN